MDYFKKPTKEFCNELEYFFSGINKYLFTDEHENYLIQLLNNGFKDIKKLRKIAEKNNSTIEERILKIENADEIAWKVRDYFIQIQKLCEPTHNFPAIIPILDNLIASCDDFMEDLFISADPKLINMINSLY